MDEDGGTAGGGPVADVGPAGLVLAEPRDRGDLQPHVRTRRVDLEVEGPGRGVAEVAGAEIEDPVLEIQGTEQDLHPLDHVGVDIGGLVGGGVGEELHLVELVDPEKTAGVASRRSCFAPEAGRGGGEPERQGDLVEDVVSVHRGERYFGRGDGPEVVALQVVGLVGEFREVAGGDHGVGADQGGGPDLLEGIGVVVEGEGGEGPQKLGPRSPVEREHRSRELGAALHVQDAEGFTDVPVRDPLVLGVGARYVRPAADGAVVLGTDAVGGVGGGQVGQPEQAIADFGLGAVSLGTELRDLGTELAALIGEADDEAVVTGAAGLGHLAGEVLHPGPELVAPSHGVSGPGVGIEQAVELGRVDGAPCQRRFHGGRILPGQTDVDHGAPTVASPFVPAISCHDLVVRYGTRTAVDGLSLQAEHGQVLALLGPNGAGKTSTVETLEGYRRPASGTVRVLGLDPTAEHRALVARMGVMLQRGGVYPVMGARRALRLFARYYSDPEDPDALLELVGLGAVASTPWRRLSGGEQQRLSLALALVGRPEVVFLDEPTAGVDPEGRLAIREVIGALKARGVCVVLTTHELPEAERLADEVVILAGGRAVARGTVAELAAAGPGPAIRFGAPAGVDVAALAIAVGAAPGDVTEERPGQYTVKGESSAGRVAAVAAWLDAQKLPLADLRTGSGSLEDAYLEAMRAEKP